MSIEIVSLCEVEPLVTRVRCAADLAVRGMRDLLGTESDSLVILRHLKFKALGRHPLEDQNLNLIEQVNQTWTFLVYAPGVAVAVQTAPQRGRLSTLSRDRRRHGYH